MRGWGREAVMAQLWALMIKAIRTDPGAGRLTRRTSWPGSRR